MASFGSLFVAPPMGVALGASSAAMGLGSRTGDAVAEAAPWSQGCGAVGLWGGGGVLWCEFLGSIQFVKNGSGGGGVKSGIPFVAPFSLWGRLD